MNLLDVIATGVAGAENGTVEIYRRGTSTFATVYTNYDGTGASTPTAGLTLDANGGRIVYVNEEVDCVVKNSTATPVRTFTAMVGAPDVEVMSQSFTGTDYSTALTGTSLPVTLATVLDRWLTNAGAVDWKVLIGGSATTLQAAFASVSGLFFNVKSTTYGAVGDGTANDTTAIAAALTAASAAGGGCVFFPKGTYKITSTLTIPGTVMLLGASPSSTRIAMDHASNDTLSLAAGGAICISNLMLRPLQANTGKIVQVENSTSAIISHCDIGGGSALSNGYGVYIDHPSAVVQITNCNIGMTAAVSYSIYNPAGDGTAIVTGCRVYHTGTMNGDMFFLNGGTYVVSGNIIDASGVTGGAGRCILAAGSYAILGNRFVAPAAGTIQPITASGTAQNGKFLAANSITAAATWTLQASPSVGASASTHEGSDSQERAVRRYYVTDNTSPITVDSSIYGVAEVRRTTNANQTINASAPPSAGLMFTLVVNNDQAGVSGTITLGTDFKGQAPFTIIANNVRAITFRSYENAAAGAGSAAKYWGFVGTTGDVTP